MYKDPNLTSSSVNKSCPVETGNSLPFTVLFCFDGPKESKCHITGRVVVPIRLGRIKTIHKMNGSVGITFTFMYAKRFGEKVLTHGEKCKQTKIEWY